MVYCPKCGSENVDDAKFCVNCGAEIKRVHKEEKTEIKKNLITEHKTQVKQHYPSSAKLLLSNKTFVIALVVAIAIICFSVLILVADPFTGSGKDNGDHSGSTIMLSVQKFYDALNGSIDNETHSIYSEVKGASSGDTLKIAGRIDKMFENYNENIGEYTSLGLYYSNELDLVVHVLGNISTEYAVGDYVVVTLHLIDYKGACKDIYGVTWTLSGEFLQEEFMDGEFAFELIIPQNQIEKI